MNCVIEEEKILLSFLFMVSVMFLIVMYFDFMVLFDEEELEMEFDDICYELNEIFKEEIDIV